MDPAQNDAKTEWLRRVLQIDVALQPSSSRVPDGQSSAEPTAADEVSEGPAELAATRGKNYPDLLLRIAAELKELAVWKDPAYFATPFAGDKAVKAFIKTKLPDLERRFGVLQGNEPLVKTLVDDADFPALRLHIDAASTLLGDITTSLRDVPQLQRDEQKRPFKESKAMLTRLLSLAPDAKEDEVNDIKARLAQVDDRDVDGVKALIAEASTLVESDGLRGQLKQALAKLAVEAGKFPAVNPVSTRLDALLDRVAEADSLSTGSTQSLLWSNVLADALAAEKAATAALKVRLGIANTLHVAEVTVQQTPKSAPRRDEMLGLIRPIREKVTSECARSTKISDVESNWQSLVVDADEASRTIAEWAGTLVDPRKARSDLAELLELTQGRGFDVFEAKPEHAQEAAEIRKRAGTDPRTLDSMAADTLRAFDAQVVKDLDRVTRVLVDTADPADLDDEMDKRAASEGDAQGAAQVRFWKEALEKRYGFKINIPEGVEASKLKQLYVLIKRLPPSQVMKDLVESFDYDTQAGPCLYSKKKIVMTNMTKEVPEEAAHKLLYPTTDGSTTELVDYFSLLTLHEIGHAVDAKNKTMPRAVGESGPGSWTNESFDAVVAKLVAHMMTGPRSGLPVKDVSAMTRDFLMTGKVNKPPSARAPLGSLLASWDELMGILGNFKGITIAQKTPWEKSVIVDGTRCYHEGYAGRWFSYDKGVRDASSVSLYQWRAPGEWFAELYAWHYIARDPKERATRASRLPDEIRDAIVA